MINTSILDAIIADNNYTAKDIQIDFDNHPEGWGCILLNDLSFDTMTEEQRNEFRNMLFEYAENNCYETDA
jgi:hypothetical protein